jgi:hypothetical protein
MYIYNLKIIATNKGMNRLLFYSILYLIVQLLVGRNPKKTIEKKLGCFTTDFGLYGHKN